MEWLDEQLVNPELVYPGSAMPEYDLETNARKAIVAFLATATPDDLKSILSGKPRSLSPEEISIEAGKQDFSRFGCVGCHGTELQGGVANPNAQGGEVPSLLHVSDDYTKDEVIAIIHNGRVPPIDNPAGPPPPLYMPSWKHVLSEEDINRIADYLWSKQQLKKESW
jgi:mono/diheme cytochrome c family protein